MSYNDPYQQQPQQPQSPQYPYQQQPQQYQYPAQGGYPPPGYAPPSSTGQTNTMAILSLVFAFVFWPAGIVCGHIAKKQIQQRNEEGGGLATAGLILSYIFGAIAIVACGIWIVAVAVVASHGTTTTG